MSLDVYVISASLIGIGFFLGSTWEVFQARRERKNEVKGRLKILVPMNQPASSEIMRILAELHGAIESNDRARKTEAIEADGPRRLQ
ncbi:hypothetical protein SAMN05660653_00163 [Desulfonatronum thiosulfatophilum]|uniref:Uncharacterized protein n=1 Tax=Desulfonatronum thiosulfatophilum TaxID=617002 RepID=A0A1G6A5L6_9BACT|nr:hypothetical protein [Desulfonatronum thiosulfatophilum]SDB03610.1 hypothetical protein SAMN05660653_00163 [Desulfonatronum thiosulfatophilum]